MDGRDDKTWNTTLHDLDDGGNTSGLNVTDWRFIGTNGYLQYIQGMNQKLQLYLFLLRSPLRSFQSRLLPS